MTSQSIDSPNVLIVEDDDGARDALGDIFDGEGYRVECSSNGQEALDFLRRSPSPHALVPKARKPDAGMLVSISAPHDT